MLTNRKECGKHSDLGSLYFGCALFVYLTGISVYIQEETIVPDDQGDRH